MPEALRCWSHAILALAIIFPLSPQLFAQETSAKHTFVASGSQFLMDGKPYQLLSGEIHYPRIPRAYWRDRFRKARAMGLNTITTYVFWNVHEPKPGVFDFSGNLDLAEFLREAQQEGLNVILRPGPYVCAEWDLGGYPAWLLKDRSLILRSDDPKFLAAQDDWFAHLAPIIKPFLIQNGGPILAIQVENEHGSFDKDNSFVKITYKQLLAHGIETPFMYTADGPSQLPYGSLPDLPVGINFGSGHAQQSFAVLDKERPNGIRFNSEYWAGWFDHWGDKHHVTSAKTDAADYAWMIDHNYSVSMYMFDGGTSFGWRNGANWTERGYEPDTTSYDYDAPIDESGNPREKFFLLRDAITKHTGVEPPPLPMPIPRRAFPVNDATKSASLWKNLPKPIKSDKLLTMEELDQNYGYVLYRTTLTTNSGGELVIDGLQDYAQIYLDSKLIGTLDRRLAQTKLNLPTNGKRLDILVEDSGRVNFTTVLRGERKGINGSVTIAGITPAHWKIYSLPMDNIAKLAFHPGPCEGPCFFRTTLHADAPADTYLDTRNIHKGFVWINNQPLGRAWNIGPQLALYTPGPWLQQGSNTIIFFDLTADTSSTIHSVADPILIGHELTSE